MGTEKENGSAGGVEREPSQVLAEEAHWQEVWRSEDAFTSQGAGDDSVLVLAGGGSHGDSLTLNDARQYVVADFHARFHRMRGTDVLFSLGLGSPAAQNEGGEASNGSTRQREQLETLGLSVDWTRSFARRDPDAHRWAEQAFLALHKAGLVARDDVPTRWCERCRTALPGQAGEGEQCPVCSEPLRQFAPGAWFLRWDSDPEAASTSMMRALRAMAPTDLVGRAEGWELDVMTTNGMPIALFAEDPKKLEEAQFVGISPRHPVLEQLIDDPGLKERVQGLLRGKSGPGGAISDTGFWVQAPPLADPLPLVITLAADARFGVTAYLGVPSANALDAAAAKNLPPPPSMRWSVKAKPSKPRQAERFRLNRLPLSAGDAGPSLSIALADGEEARLDPLMATWMETLVAIPPEDRAAAEPSHPEIQRWVAEMHTFREAASGSALLGDLALIEALGVNREIGGGEHGEAPALDLIVGPIDGGAEGSAEEADLQQLAQRFGADALRFAILHGSAPAKRLDRGELEAALAPAALFLTQLRRYAEPRLSPAGDAVAEASDADDPLGNRLRKWCRTALWKVTENEERLDPHRATRNLQILLARIEDFERQAVQERGDLTAQDRQLIHEALCLLIGLLAPIAPHLAEVLWKQAGNDGLACRAPWPRALEPVPG
ncbi:MAG: class I tRNA ligase family protein [Solirubrobacterales bacterium]